MKNLKSIIALLVLTVFSVNAWGAVANPYSFTFANGDLTTSSKSFKKGSVTWSLSVTEDSWDGSSSKSGYRFGSASSTKTLVMSTSDISGTITKVSVTGRSNNSGKTATVSVKVGTTSFTTSDDSWDNGNNQTLNFSGSASGTIEVTITPSACGYIVNGISVTYSTGPTKLGTPTGLSSSNVTKNSATIEWNKVTNASGYSVSCIGATIEEISVGTTKASCQLTGLSKATQYIWKVKAIGDGTSYADGDYSSIANFTTLGPTFTDFITECSGDPEISVSSAAIEGLGYVYGSTESTVKTFVVVGNNLGSKVTITAPTWFEVKQEGGNFADAIDLVPTDGLLNKTISVRLSTGKTAGDYEGNITISSTEVESKYVDLSATVIPVFTVKFYNSGSELTDLETQIVEGAAVGELPILTEADACDPHSRTFVGWMVGTIDGKSATAPTTLVDASTKVNAAMTLNAVWAEGGTSYERVTDVNQLADGQNIIIQDNSHLLLNTIGNGSVLTETDNKVTPTNDNQIWKLVKDEDDWVFVGANNKKVFVTDKTDDLTFTSDGSNEYYYWTITESTRSSDYFWIYLEGESKDYYWEYNNKWITYGIDNNYWPSETQDGYMKQRLYVSSLTNYITTCSTDPLIEVPTESLSDFSTTATAGPSAAQSFTVEGYNLTENITVSAPTGYEVSTTEASDYTSSLTLTAINGIVAKTPVYVRLAAADEAKDNVTGNITLVSSNTEQTIALTGTIIAKTLNSISIKTAPKTTYTIGDKFDPTGLVITATYNSGNEEVAYSGHEDEFTFSPILETALTASDNKVTITWGGQSKDQSITMQCTVAWQVNGQPWETGNPTTKVNVGSAITDMPTDPTSEACNGKTFMGWSVKTVAKTDDEPEMFAKLADFKTLDAHTIYHAVFAKAGEGDGNSSSITEFATGEYYLVDTYDSKYFAPTGTGSTVASVDITSAVTANEDGTISIDATNSVITETMVYIIAGTASEATVQNKKDSKYIGGSTSTSFSTTNTNKWVVTEGTTTEPDRFTFKGTDNRCVLYRSGNDFRNYSSSNRGASGYGTGYLYLVPAGPGITYSEYSTTCFEPVDVPVFDLAEGTYKTAQEVKLTCATDDSKIYYSINGGDVTEYTAKIQLEERGTYSITAYAKVGEERISDPVTKEYTLNLPYENIQAMYAANLADNIEVGLTLTDAYINKVYSVSNNKQIFVQQGNVGAILAMSGDVPEGLADGKALTATVWGTYKINNDRPQLSNFTLVEGYQVAEGTRPTPAVITSLDAEVASTNLLGIVTMKGVYSISKESNNITMNSQADGLGTNYALYNIFSAVKALPEQSLACDVIGLFNVKDGAYSIMPIVVATDFKLQTSKDATLPNIDIVGGATSENPVLVPANQVVTLTAVDGFDAYYKVNGGTEAKFTGTKTVTITEPTSSITLRGARDYYTDVTVTYYYGIDEAHTAHVVNKPDVGPYTYSADKASAEAGEFVKMTITPSEHWNILSVKAEYNDGEADQSITATSIGDNQYTFEMPDYDVKIKVDRKQDPTYNVTYLKGGKTTEGEDPQNSTQFEGDIVTVAANSWTATGYTFEGWKITYTNSESQEVVITPEEGKFEMPAFDVKITATWKKIASFGWKLVESTSDLTVGDKVVIACNTKEAAAGAISSSVMSKVDATFSEDSKYLISDLKDVVILTVGGEAGAWTFANDNSQLLGATAEKKVAWDGQNATNTWEISVDANTYAATIQNTHKTNNAYDYGRFLHNVNSTRFTTYNSAANNSMLLPQLYKRVELAYIVTYVANGGSNPPADTYADQDGSVTITSLQPTWNNAHLFIGWNTDKDGNGEEYLAGETYMIEDNLKLYAQWKTVEEHSITFVAGEGATGAVPTISKKYEGMTFEMPDKGTLVKTGFLFRGWNDGSATYLAGETYTMPGNDVTFNAVWESKADSKWHLVTNAQMLTDGSKIIIAAAGYNQAMGVIETGDSYCQEVAISKIMDVDHYNDQKLIDENEPVILTLMKNTDGSFALKNGTNFLSAQSSGNNIKYSTTIDAMSSWNITIEDDVTKIVTTGSAASKNLQYNSDAKRFSCYTGTQKAIAIYKYIDGNKAVREVSAETYTTFCIPQGVEVGNFYGATFWNIADKAYMEDGVRLYSITIEQEEGNLVAGVPYIMLPDAETTEFVYYATGEEEVAGTNNGLYGTFVDYAFDENETDARDAQQLYVISNGTLYLCGTGCGVYANRAYIKSDKINYVAPSGAPRRTIGRPNDTPTTLNGLFGNQAGKAQKALIDGHIFILRDNKMYNAQGQFVK